MRLQWTRTDAEDKPFSPAQCDLGRKPQGMPTGYWRFVQRARWVSWLGLVLAGMGGLMGVRMVILPGANVGELQAWLMISCGVAGALVCAVTPGLMKRRFLRKLHASGYALCLACGYRLSGLPPEHRCPECGEDFELANVQA